jgi:pimeloyl-ACP methyl ester carboxylesterase
MWEVWIQGSVRLHPLYIEIVLRNDLRSALTHPQFHSRGGPESLSRSLFCSRTNARVVGVFCSWPQTAKDLAQMAQTMLTMPVLSIGGDKSLGKPLAKQMKLVATDVTVVIVKNSGHWILEEQPKQTTDALLNFL